MLRAEREFSERVEAVVFDVDGTLIDTLEVFQAVAREVAEEHGLHVRRDQVAQALATGQRLWDELVDASVPDRERRIDQMRLAARASLARHCVHARPFSGVERTLARLRAAGLRLGVCTDSRGESVEVLERHGLCSRFDAVVSRGEDEPRKPDPSNLLRCFERLGVLPGRALFVGDTLMDMLAGMRAGCAVAGVCTGFGTATQLRDAGTTHVVDSHSSIPDLLGL